MPAQGSLEATVRGTLDVEAAQRVLEQAAVQQRVPRPRLGEWWRDVLTRVAEVLAGIFDLSSATVRSLLTLASWGLIALAAVVLLGWVASVLWRRRIAAKDEGSEGVTTTIAVDASSAMDWEQRLRDALARRDVSAALRAQWQILFARLGLDGATPRAPAARPLLRSFRARSQAASSALHRLERWTYGGRRPAIEDLRGLQTEFDSVLPDRGPERAP